MHIHRSNRLECLLSALADVIGDTAPEDPFSPITVVVQSQGMASWLSLGLSERLGVWANPAFPFPRVVIERALSALVPGDGGDVPLERDALSLAVAARLPAHLEEPAFAPLRSYLADDHGADRLLQLADRIGGLFDDYAVFRADLVEASVRAPGPDDWQAILLHELAQDFGAYHVGGRARAFYRALAANRGPLPEFPEQLHIFGIASLPPLYLDVLVALSERIPVHLFLMSPTREFWAHLKSAREQARIERQHGSAAVVHVDEGHPLLASLGKLGRDYFGLLESRVEHYDSEQDLFVEPGHGSLLSLLQSDILHLRPPPAGGDETGVRQAGDNRARVVVPVRDKSVRVNLCHSPMREVEVLHDQLADALQDPDLRPDDVVVMAPDIEVYAPAILAVFGQETGRPSIPFRIADRGLFTDNPLYQTLSAVLDALSGRMEAPAVLDVLAMPAVRRRFEIAEAELETVRTWVDMAGIRWAVDAAHREELGQPALHESTWRFGLERLMLGYAMEGRGHQLFAGRLPYDDIEGSEAALLGRFADFCEVLFVQRKACRGPHPLPVWRTRLLSLMDALMLPGGEAQDSLLAVQDALFELVADAERTGFSGPVALAPLLRLLSQRLTHRRGSLGFMMGGVTFCQMLPMRSIPFSVVAMLGLDDGAFPRLGRSLSFDKRRASPRPGDRNPRDDDRYLFLEALLSARSQLLISYVGRGVHDNGVRPPSVLVSELLDVLDEAYRFEAGDARKHVCVEHRLQPFSPAYFGASDDPRLFSFARGYYEGAVTVHASAPESGLAFLAAPLPPPEQAGTLTVELAERYLGHPVRAFLQERLGLFLGRDAAPLAGREALDLDPLSRWQVGQELLDHTRKGRALDTLGAPLLASGQLPLGTLGELAYQDLSPVVARIAAARDAYLPPAAAGARAVFERRRIALTVAGLTLEGELHGLCDAAQVVGQFTRVGRRAELSAWLRHVLANVAAGRTPNVGIPTASVLIGRAPKGDQLACVHLSPLDDPEGVAGRVVAWLMRARCQPLPFAHDASRTFAERLREGKSEAEALGAARKAFEGDFGDGDDPYLQQVFGGFDGLCAAVDPTFGELAQAVFSELLAHRTEESVG